MMLGIQIAGEFLDLDPDTTLQLEQSNPFLQLNDEVIGQYSLPFQVLLNNKNMRLLNFAGIVQNSVSNAGFDAFIYQNGLQAGVGKVKIEKATINLNKNQKPVINCYYLSGAGGFYQDAKDKKMRSIDVGGDRTFAGGGDFLLATAFYAHVHAVMIGDIAEYDYAFYPVANSSWGDDPGPEIVCMNQIFFADPIPIGPGDVIVPFPYLKYVLIKAVEYLGWKLEGDILTDVDFQKITMINFRAIDWGYYKLPTSGFYPYDSITFNLQDHLPDMTIPEFMIALKNRLGWWYDFDNVSNKITIRYLRDLVTLEQKDMTRKSSPVVIKSILTENKLYALKNNFITGGGEGIDITKVNFQGNVNKTSDLPAPVEALVAQVYLVIEENNYYICFQSAGDPDVWEWQIAAANIYDYLPAGYNEEITTSATTVAMVRFSDYLDLIPQVDSPGIWHGQNGETPWGIHLAFFYGMRANKSALTIPFASHHIYDSQGFTLAAWSLAFKALKTDSTEVGLYDVYFKPFLDMLNSAEQIELTLYLPFVEYLSLKFSDRITVDGVKMFVSKINATLPYKGQIPIEALRIP